ncbi:aminotransferase class IV family protein [Candidatus Uhrbacteria bacterium]|nr:aminotransferase class IV family protein [Candidatus Uhrbacteria bacterium]
MTFSHFSKNGTILPHDDAVIPLQSIEYTYGFGVYETIRVLNGTSYFLKDHCERLIASAKIIDLEHMFTNVFIAEAIVDLVKTLGESATCNLKVLLVGAPTKEDAQLFILPLAPLFPDKKLYRGGIRTLVASYERLYPQAKTLNMLPSYLLYRKARQEGCYDTIFMNRDGCITEGTRTNFFAIRDKTLFTAPDEMVLAGVTRKTVLRVARQSKFSIEERALDLSEIKSCDGAFVTGTSIGIMPVKTIDDFSFTEIPSALRELMAQYDVFKKTCHGVMPKEYE